MSKSSKYKKIRIALLMFSICFIILQVIYTIWDNQRIVIVEQEIVIDHLPEEFEGFSILQITDLHEKEFGKNQRRMVQLINSIDYDVIVFTGDMLDDEESTNYKSFYNLIDKIENKENALFVPGNTDPQNYILNSNQLYEKNNFVKGMEKRDVYLLESVYSVKGMNSIIYFVDFENSFLFVEKELDFIDQKKENNSNKIMIENQKVLEDLTILDSIKDTDVMIALNHYPVADTRIDQLIDDGVFKFRNYDLIIAGHYHGGQIRFPFIGAIFVPEPTYGGGGLFPPFDRVKGLWEYNDIKQYVSAGLGSSDAIPFMKFRFLNPPEINLLKLTSGN